MLIIHLLPLAAGAAVSPALLGASVEILLAFGARGARMLLNYLLGALVVVVAAGTLAFLLPKRPATAGGSLLIDVVEVVLGAMLVVIALVLAFRRPGKLKDGRAKRLRSSRWAGAAVFGFGVVTMATNVGTLVLVLAGAHEVFSAAAGPAVRALGLGLLALGALAPILLPLLWVALRPAAAARELQRVNTFIARHGRTLGVAVCILTGGYLLARGFVAI